MDGGHNMPCTTMSDLQLFLVDLWPEANNPPKSLQAWDTFQHPLSSLVHHFRTVSHHGPRANGLKPQTELTQLQIACEHKPAGRRFSTPP